MKKIEDIAAVEAQMLIRRPAMEVYNAFIDPSITTQFWFTKSSSPLEEQKTVTWQWEMYEASVDVLVKQLTPGKKIVYDWGPPNSTVELDFLSITEESTYVSIRNFGFNQTGDELRATLKNGTEGFAIVLAGLKAYLEHGIKLNLIEDKYPKEVATFKK